MDLTELTTDQVSGLSNEVLAGVRDRASYNATLIENRNVISDSNHRIARRLRALHHAAERELAGRQAIKQSEGHKKHDGSDAGITAQSRNQPREIINETNHRQRKPLPC